MGRQNSIILSIAALVLILGGILLYAEPDNNTQPGQDNEQHQTEDVLKPDRDLHDFGTISMKDGKVKTAFKVRNENAEAVQMNKLYTSCMCTEAVLKLQDKRLGPYGMPGHGAFPTFKESLAPGQEAEIEIVFDPNAHGPSGVGPIERVVVLEDTSHELLNIQIKANVIP